MSATTTSPGSGVTTPPPTELTPDHDRRTLLGSTLQSVLAVLAALILGGLLIALTDEKVREAAGYFFARPSDTFSAMWDAASGAYIAMFHGAVYNPDGSGAAGKLYPLTETLTVATPLILAGLGVALAFRAGLFNIGAQGQILVGATLAGYVGFAWHLPAGIHLIAVVLAGALGGAVWGGVVGVIKARTGAHEVILTIMLNYVAMNLVAWLLTQRSFQRPDSSNPISPEIAHTAMLPKLLGSEFRLHWGFVVAVLATAAVSWLLNRSTIGFELRAVGANPRAARTAGISVTKGFAVVMLLAGLLSGLAGVAQIAGTEHSLTTGIAASFGFDAITVALLGRSTPWGTFLAGLLYGAFRAGGVAMQSQTGTNIDIVLVVQSLIVLFVALPPLLKLKPRRKEVAA